MFCTWYTALITHFQIRFKLIWNRSREGILKLLRERSIILWQQSKNHVLFSLSNKTSLHKCIWEFKNRVGVISFKHKIGTRSNRDKLVIQNLTWLESPSDFNQFSNVQDHTGGKKNNLTLSRWSPATLQTLHDRLVVLWRCTFRCGVKILGVELSHLL